MDGSCSLGGALSVSLSTPPSTRACPSTTSKSDTVSNELGDGRRDALDLGRVDKERLDDAPPPKFALQRPVVEEASTFQSHGRATKDVRRARLHVNHARVHEAGLPAIGLCARGGADAVLLRYVNTLLSAVYCCALSETSTIVLSRWVPDGGWHHRLPLATSYDACTTCTSVKLQRASHAEEKPEPLMVTTRLLLVSPITGQMLEIRGVLMNAHTSPSTVYCWPLSVTSNGRKLALAFGEIHLSAASPWLLASTNGSNSHTLWLPCLTRFVPMIATERRLCVKRESEFGRRVLLCVEARAQHDDARDSQGRHKFDMVRPWHGRHEHAKVGAESIQVDPVVGTVAVECA
eukprot:scaffold26940_cov117-Phaeocystis_antarctica.AAC.9